MVVECIQGEHTLMDSLVERQLGDAVPIEWSTLETHSFAWPMNSSAALLRFVLTRDGSEAGFCTGLCIHAVPRGYQIKSGQGPAVFRAQVL